MAIMKVQKYGSPILREKAIPVNKVDDEIRELVDNMIETMYVEGGAGLAAPQVGISKRVIIIDTEDQGVMVLINPVILKREGETAQEEGCLSVPGIYSSVKRSSVITIEALDLEQNKIRMTQEGFLAIVLQHEIDHLDGYLFIDRLSPAKRMLIKDQLREIE